LFLKILIAGEFCLTRDTGNRKKCYGSRL